MSCHNMEKHIGQEMWSQAQSFRGHACEWWDPEQTQQLMKAVNEEQQLQHWALQWLDYASHKKPWLAPGQQKHLTILRTEVLEQSPFTVKDMLSLSRKLGPLAAIGYDHVALVRESMKQAHQPHYRFRNEWWTFHGTCQNSAQERGFLLLQVHRHTLIPPSLWQEPSGQDASVLALTLKWRKPGASLWEEEELQWVRQSSGLRQLNADSTHFFQVTQKPWFVQSVYRDTLFPLEIHWKVGQTVVRALLDNSKPLLMVHSNGCLQCSDGIGVKMYTYPEVQGVGQYDEELVNWQGYWEHMWESSMYPKGLANSLFMRALINVEQSIHTLPEQHVWSTLHLLRVDTQEEWYIAVLGWHRRNTVQYALYIAPDGSTQRLPAEELWLEVTEQDPVAPYPLAVTVHQKKQPTFQLRLLETSVKRSGWLFTGTFWDEQHQLFGSLQLPENHGADWNREAETTEQVWSWVIWIFPLLIILALMTFSVLLVVKRYKGSRHPWTVSRHHTTFLPW